MYVYFLLGRLNWWASTGRLLKLEPLATSGDGNCLLHAASLYMWGFHDHLLILRTGLHRLLTTGLEKEGLKRRWQYQTQLRNNEAGGLTFSEEEWDFEWEEILRIATNKPRQQPTTDSLRRYSSLRLSYHYESLEEIHISVLAHTLRRPIIVISDRTIKDWNGQDLAPIYFGGIYLPLEVNPTACYKSPIVLAYDSSHFSPLVARKDGFEQKGHTSSKYARISDRKETVIPLVTPDGSLLPVQFIFDPTKKDVREKWSKMEYEVGEFPDDIVRLLESYLNVRWIKLNVPTCDTGGCDQNLLFQVPKIRFPAASITQETEPIYQKELVGKYLEHIKTKFQEEVEKKARRQAEREQEEIKRLQNKSVPCEGEGCNMFGRPATNNMCSVCYQKSLIVAESDGKLLKGGSELARSSVHQKESGVVLTDMTNQITGITPPLQESPDTQFISRSPDHHRPILQQKGDLHRDGDRKKSPEHITRQVLTDHANADKLTTHLHVGSQNQSKANTYSHQEKLPLSSPTSAIVSLTDTSHAPVIRNHSPANDNLSHSSNSVSPVKSAPPNPSPRRAPPPLQKGNVINNSSSNSEPASGGQIPKPSPKKWVSNLVPSIFKKDALPTKSGNYSRDSIPSLHLENNNTGVEDVNERDGNRQETCKMSNCTFFGSPSNGGYCSKCYRELEKQATPV